MRKDISEGSVSFSFIRQIQQRPVQPNCPFAASAWKEEFSKKELVVHSLCTFSTGAIIVKTILQWILQWTSSHPPLGIIPLMYRNLRALCSHNFIERKNPEVS